MYGLEVIVRYLQDTEAAERTFEDALASFSKAGEQGPVRTALADMSDKARTQHERLRARIEALGGSPSTAKSALAHALAFSPPMTQMSQAPGEKNTQHLIITIAAAAAETAMYEALATAASAAGDSSTEQLARQLQSEERADYRQAADLLRASALDAAQAQVRDGEKWSDLIKRYLEDAIAAEKSFETQLRAFAKEGSSDEIHRLYLKHADETRWQYEQLTTRLHALGGETSGFKSFLAHLFAFSPKMAQVGHDTVDRVTQNLMMAYSVENCEVAMYESLIVVGEAAGDTETANLARTIQQQERATAEKIWAHIAPWAHTSFNKLAGAEQVHSS